MKNLNLLLSFLIIAFAGCDPAGTSNDKEHWTKAVEELLNERHLNNAFDGTVVIGTKDEVLMTYAVGIANRNWNTNIADDTRFDIASLNKSFQAGLILKAVEEGKLTLEDRLIQFFPSLGFDSLITIHQMLTHTSGLPDYDAVDEDLKKDHFEAFKRKSFSNEAYAKFISSLEPVGQPGKQFYYSNFAYHLLALILEKIYERSFNEILQEKICNPFGLDNTFSDTDNRKVHQNVAEGYTFSEEDSSYFRNNFIDLSLGRRIFSTSEDLYAWANLLMSEKFISNDSYQLMTTNHLKEIEQNISYGYGFVVFDGGQYAMGDLDIDDKYIIHGGKTEGYKSILVNVNQGELILTFLTNVGNQVDEIELTKTILKTRNE